MAGLSAPFKVDINIEVVERKSFWHYSTQRETIQNTNTYTINSIFTTTTKTYLFPTHLLLLLLNTKRHESLMRLSDGLSVDIPHLRRRLLLLMMILWVYLL